MTVTYVDLINGTVLGIPQCNNYHFESISHDINRLDDMTNYRPSRLGEHTVHLLSFKLRNGAGGISDNTLELFLTETPFKSTQIQQQQKEQTENCTIYVIAPRIWWNKQYFELFPQFSLISNDCHPEKTPIEEVTDEINERLSLPINRLQNSVNSFSRLFANEDIHQKVLASLRPKDVGRMESVSVSVRNILLSVSVDNDFWKKNYERLFGKVQDSRQKSYRVRFGDQMRWQMKTSRMLMALPSSIRAQTPGDIPEEPHLSPVNPLLPRTYNDDDDNYYDPHDPTRRRPTKPPTHPGIGDNPFSRPLQPDGPDLNDPLRPRPAQPTYPNHPDRKKPDGPRPEPYGPISPNEPGFFDGGVFGGGAYGGGGYNGGGSYGGGGYNGGGSYGGGAYNGGGQNPYQPGHPYNGDPSGRGNDPDKPKFEDPGSSGGAGGSGGFFGPGGGCGYF